MTLAYYILIEHEPLEVDLQTWVDWFESHSFDRIVCRTGIEGATHVEISTVFLGLDHNWGDGPPLLFESLVFGGPLDGEMRRYTTWGEAVVGHGEMVAQCLAARAGVS